jgi:23S rRNA (pseudouridine1915-N3)-methyltransferase
MSKKSKKIKRIKKMQRITVITVGTIKTSWLQSGCSEYSQRLQRVVDLNIIEISPSKQKDPAKQQEEESQALLHRLQKIDGKVWILDETGDEMLSEQFAKEFGALADIGHSIVFILGGAYGLSDAIKKKADQLFALSQMTFPHELCRLVLLEQLYRASEIRRGSGYHH